MKKFDVTVKWISIFGQIQEAKHFGMEAKDFHSIIDEINPIYAGANVQSIEIKDVTKPEITIDELVNRIWNSAIVGLSPGNDKRRELELIKNMIQAYRDQ